MNKQEKEILEAIEKAEKENPRYPLNEGRGFDYLIIFAIAKKFSTPFNKTQAYKLGIINDKGEIIKPPTTVNERNAFTPLDNIVIRIKRLIPKNLWYLLTFAYIFKGFISQRTYKSFYESCLTEEEMLKEEEKQLALIRARKEVQEIINSSSQYTSDEFWTFVIENEDI